jgi:hypothetical protein
MPTATKPTKIDPIFAAIEAHRQAVIARMPILEMRMTTGDDAPDSATFDDALDAACEAEIEAQAALTNITATTIPGLMAVTVYVSKLTNRGHDWTIGGDLIDEDAGDTESRSFEACLIRSCAVALAQINGVTAISARS